jgi:hypothetical protein
MPLTNFDDEIALDLSLVAALGPLEADVVPDGESELISYAFDVHLDGGAVTFSSEDQDQAQEAWNAISAALHGHGDLVAGGGVELLTSAVLAIGPVAEDEEEEHKNWFFEILVPGSSLIAEFDSESAATAFWNKLQQEAGH